MDFKHLILLVSFVQVLHYRAADTSLISSIVKSVIPSCYFGIDYISFILYTREIPNGIVLTTENITSTNEWKEHVQTRTILFLIHGFVSSANTTSFNELVTACLEEGDYLVISINWKDAACGNGLFLLEYSGYYEAVKHTRDIGVYVANLTQMLITKYGAKIENIQLIGHSLGAHVAGFAGKKVQELNLGQYPVIYGLDPAGPFFRFNDCDDRICKTDADKVVVVHTTEVLGTSRTLGTVDFYMHGGELQPACGINEVCSHSSSVSYFTESVRNNYCYEAIPWDKTSSVSLSDCANETCSYVGRYAYYHNTTGTYYVPVDGTPPYCNNNRTASSS